MCQNIFLRKQVFGLFAQSKESTQESRILSQRSDQGSSRKGFGRIDRPQLSWPIPQAGLMLVVHLPYGNYNMATQNSGPAAFSSGLAASVSLYNLYIQTKMNSNCRILPPFDRSAVTLHTTAALTNLYQQQFYLQNFKLNQVEL